MRITGFNLALSSIPLAEEVKWANVAESAIELLTLRIETDEGCFGLAQKKAHPVWAGTTNRTLAVELKEVFEPLLRNQDPLRPERLWARLDPVIGWSPGKTMVDIALHDLAARAAGAPMWRHLGGWSDEVAVSGFIARGPLDVRLAEMAALIERFGLRAFKIKIGLDPVADCAFIAAVRKEFGEGMLLRVDANSGYQLEDAIKVSHTLADLGVMDFEDPCSLAGRNVRAEVLRRSAAPVVVDYIIDTPATAQRLIDEGFLRLAIKVSRLGYTRSLAVLRACREAGVRPVIGSLTEGALGALTSLHFHAAFEACEWAPAEESYFATLADDIFERPVIIDGKVKLPSTPGICGDWDDAAVRRLAVPLNI